MAGRVDSGRRRVLGRDGGRGLLQVCVEDGAMVLRRVRRWVVAGALAAGAWFLPPLVATTPARDWLVGQFLPKMNGSLHSRAAEFHWLRPVRLEGLELIGADGPILSAASAEGDRPLWRLLLSPRAPGWFTVRGGQLRVVVDDDGANLARLFRRSEATAARRPVQVGIEIVDARVLYKGPRTTAPWTVGPIGAKLEFQRADAAALTGMLVVHPGRALDRLELTEAMAADIARFVLPVVAGAAETSGQFSLDVDRWEVPLEEPQQATGSGRVTIHAVDVHSGAMLARLAAVLRLPATLRLMEESVVPFEMKAGRVFHRDLKVALKNLALSTSGSVGIDQSLDVVANVELPHTDGETPRRLHIPIRGTLVEPRIDLTALRQTGGEAMRGALDELLRAGPGAAADLLERLRGRGR